MGDRFISGDEIMLPRNRLRDDISSCKSMKIAERAGAQVQATADYASNGYWTGGSYREAMAAMDFFTVPTLNFSAQLFVAPGFCRNARTCPVIRAAKASSLI